MSKASIFWCRGAKVVFALLSPCYLDIKDQFKILSVTGGAPRYLEELDSKLTAEENIKELCFTKSGILFREFNDIFSDIFSSRASSYKKIVESLVLGVKELGQIADNLNMQSTSHVSEY